MSESARPRGVLLDLDGTLVDSNDAHAHAWAEALTRAGWHVSFEDVRPRIGMGADKLIPLFTGMPAESENAQELARRRTRLFLESHLPHVRPFPRTRELLLRMRQERLRLILATSARDEELAGLLTMAGVADLLDAHTSADDAGASKPDPDVILAAVKLSGLRPAQLVLLGDTPYDVTAGRSAGVPVIALRCGGYWTDRDLAGAVAIYDSPAALLAGFESSLLGRGRGGELTAGAP
ncbi:MAG: HAD family phosphatase [Myxococcota bacterium]